MLRAVLRAIHPTDIHALASNDASAPSSFHPLAQHESSHSIMTAEPSDRLIWWGIPDHSTDSGGGG